MDNFEAVMKDDGHAIELASTVRSRVLETALDARELSSTGMLTSLDVMSRAYRQITARA